MSSAIALAIVLQNYSITVPLWYLQKSYANPGALNCPGLDKFLKVPEKAEKRGPNTILAMSK